MKCRLDNTVRSAHCHIGDFSGTTRWEISTRRRVQGEIVLTLIVVIVRVGSSTIHKRKK